MKDHFPIPPCPYSETPALRAGLIGELVRLVERFWGDARRELAPLVRTGELDDILGRVWRYADKIQTGEKIDETIRLEADWADEARRLAGLCASLPQGIDRDRAERDAAELAAKRKALLCRYTALMLSRMFGLEVSQFAFECFRPGSAGGLVAFQPPDPAATEKRADALRRLAEFLDKFDETGECSNVHDVVREYYSPRSISNPLRLCGSA